MEIVVGWGHMVHAVGTERREWYGTQLGFISSSRDDIYSAQRMSVIGFE